MKQLLTLSAFIVGMALFSFAQPQPFQLIDNAAPGFGQAIDINGDQMIVAADGVAFTYKWNGTNWMEAGIITTDDIAGFATSTPSREWTNFGMAVGIIDSFAFVTFLNNENTPENARNPNTGQFETANLILRDVNTAIFRKTNQGWVFDRLILGFRQVAATEGNKVLLITNYYESLTFDDGTIDEEGRLGSSIFSRENGRWESESQRFFKDYTSEQTFLGLAFGEYFDFVSFDDKIFFSSPEENQTYVLERESFENWATIETLTNAPYSSGLQGNVAISSSSPLETSCNPSAKILAKSGSNWSVQENLNISKTSFNNDRLITAGNVNCSGQTSFLQFYDCTSNSCILNFQLNAPNGGNSFGASIFDAGSQIAVGAPGEQRVYCYDPSDAGFSEATPESSAMLSSTSSGFGKEVDVNGDYMIVSSDDKAFIYKKTNGQWTQQQELSFADCPTCRDTSFVAVIPYTNRFFEPDTAIRTHKKIYRNFGETVGIIDGYAFVSYILFTDTAFVNYALQDVFRDESFLLVFKEGANGWSLVDNLPFPEGRILDTEDNTLLLSTYKWEEQFDQDQTAEEAITEFYVIERNPTSWTSTFVDVDGAFTIDLIRNHFRFGGDLTDDKDKFAISNGLMYEKQANGSWLEIDNLGAYYDFFFASRQFDISYSGDFYVSGDGPEPFFNFQNIYKRENGSWNDEYISIPFNANNLHSQRLLLQRNNNGGSYVSQYQLGPDTLSFVSNIFAPENPSQARFGASLDDDGTTYVIGAPGINKVYIFGPSVPTEVKNLRIHALCSPDPSTELRWRVKNPNPFPVTYIWAQWWSPQRDTLIAPPGLSFFFTQTNAQDPSTGAGLGIYGDDNITGVWWVDENNQTASAWDFPNYDQCNLRTLAQQNPQKGRFLPGEIQLTFPIETIVKEEGFAKAYPNPTSGILRVESKIPTTLRLFDISGRLLIKANEQVATEEHELRMDHLPNGIYILEVSNEVQSQKIRVVKQ